MAVWLCVPSARPVEEVKAWAEKWKCQGYHVALWRDDGYPIEGVDLTIGGAYPGWPKAANALIAEALSRDPECGWTVGGGDDVWPDPNKRAGEIAAECTEHFGEHWSDRLYYGDIPSRSGMWDWPVSAYDTFGVMQPTGDDWRDHQGRIIERIAGSPWIGREYALRINGGHGPWHSEYFHNWADQEMQEVATMLGVFWQRPDLCHFHDHCLRYPGGKWAPHLQGVSADYTRMKPLFEERRKNGFPGSAPL